MSLKITLLDIDKVSPNPWNPNVQNEVQYKAEIESILDNGFLAPILTRQTDSGWEVIDGEHRLRALKEIFDSGKEGKFNLPDLAKKRHIPAVVIEANDAKAKKLTVVMNETRGRADMASLGALLASIQPELGTDLGLGLPYTEAQLQELISIGDFAWEDLEVPNYDLPDHDGESEGNGWNLTATLDKDTTTRWKETFAIYKDELPKDQKAAAGILIAKLLNKA